MNLRRLFCRHHYVKIKKKTCGEVAKELQRVFPGLGISVEDRYKDVVFLHNFLTIKYRGEILKIKEGYGKPFVEVGDQICVKCGNKIVGLGNLIKAVERAMLDVDKHLASKEKAVKMWIKDQKENV